MEEVVALGGYRGLQVGSWLMGGDQGQVVVRVDLYV